MGLFDKKTCAACGNKKGLLGSKLADGNYLCSNCSMKYFYIESFEFMDKNKKEAKYHTKIREDKITLEEYHKLIQLRERNLEELQNFNCTKSYGEIVHIDVDNARMIFVDKIIFENKKRLYKENPPVFKMADLAFARMTFSEDKESVSITGAAKVESKILLTLGFEDPVYDIIHMEVGRITAKSGLFGTRSKAPKDIAELMQVVGSILEWDVAWDDDCDLDVPDICMDSYWKLAKKANDHGYMSRDDLKMCLKNYYGKDKKLMREVKKKYDL